MSYAIPNTESSRSFVYLAIILGLIFICGIEAGLTLSVLLVSILSLLTWLPFYSRLSPMKKTILYECRDMWGVLLLVWLIRSFVMQPFRVPTGSLEPTIRPGEFLLVKQWTYGLRWPVIHRPFYGKSWHPKRGDIALFYWPVNPSIIFIKRVIGLPGDDITYHHKTLYINGKIVPQNNPKTIQHVDETGRHQTFIQVTETLGHVKHAMYINPAIPHAPYQHWHVPAGHYFMMGDNRDNSGDSRYWGFVSDNALIGQPQWIFMSWNPAAWLEKRYHQLIRWHRLGNHVT